jgi:hypothetical protein
VKLTERLLERGVRRLCRNLQYRLPAVLQALARVMGSIGGVTSGIVSEVAGVEGWLATQQPRSGGPRSDFLSDRLANQSHDTGGLGGLWANYM